jgi:hypothetical protein
MPNKIAEIQHLVSQVLQMRKQFSEVNDLFNTSQLGNRREGEKSRMCFLQNHKKIQGIKSLVRLDFSLLPSFRYSYLF